MIAAVSSRFLGRIGWQAEKPAVTPASGAQGSDVPKPPRGGFGGRFAVILSGELIQSLFHFVLNIALVRTLSQRTTASSPSSSSAARSPSPMPGQASPCRRLLHRPCPGTAVRTRLRCAVRHRGLRPLRRHHADRVRRLLPSSRRGAWAAGSFVALYAFRSYQRIVLLARKAPRIAGLSDLVYANRRHRLDPLLHPRVDHVTPTHAFLSLTLAHACGVLVSFLRLGQPIRLTFKRKLWRRYLAIWRSLTWSLAGITTNTLQGQGITIAFAAIVGPSDYAPIAATLVLFAPLRIPTNALTNMALAEVSELLAKGRVDLARQIVVRSNIVIAAGCLVYGGAMLLTLPLIEHYLFGGKFDHEPMGWIAAGIWAMMLLSLLYAIPRAFLEATGSFRASPGARASDL